MRVAFDTNVLVYAESLDDMPRRLRAREVLAGLDGHELVLPVQAAGELLRVLMRRSRLSAVEAAARVRHWRCLFQHRPDTTDRVFEGALDLMAAHPVQVWDAIIVNAAAQAGAAILLSEDMTDGFVWRGVTIVDPFRPDPHPLLADLLDARHP